MTNDKALEAALPGEGEVVAWRGDAAGGGRKFTAMSRVSEIWADQCLIVTPLVTLASFQAMQARAEAAERERDYWQKLHDERTAFLGQCAAEKEAAEDRVKELEEALEPFSDVDAPEHSHLPDETPVAIRHEMLLDLTLSLGHFRRARTALKGGSNG